MWQALRAELAYSRSYLLGGLGLAAGVAVMVSVVFYAVGEEGPPPHAAAGIRGMFLIMAPMIVGFIMTPIYVFFFLILMLLQLRVSCTCTHACFECAKRLFS